MKLRRPPAPGSADTKTRSIGRGISVGLLIVVASLLVVVSVVGIWLNTVAFDTPTWRSTSRQMIQNPAIQHEVSQYLVGQLYDSNVTQSEINKALPPALQQFSPAVTNGLRQFAVQAGERLLGRPNVQDLWVAANDKAHTELVNLIENKSTFTNVDNGKVVLDLHAVLLNVANEAGIGAAAQRLLPANAGYLTVMSSSELSSVQSATRIIHAVALWVPLVTIVLFALAIWIARGFRRRALLWSAIGVLLAAGALMLVRQELGTKIIDALASDTAVRPALIEAWFIGTQVLGTINQTLMIAAIVLIAGVWLAGAGRFSTATRRGLAPWIMNPFSAFGIPAAILIILAVWGPLPVFQKLIPMIIIVVLSAVGIEALRRLTITEHASR